MMVDAELPRPERRADIMAMPITIPRLTIDDLDHFPDDGNRYELIDGVLLVTPAPGAPHQVIATRISTALSNLLAPYPDFLVAAPGVVLVAPRHRLEPDVLVFRSRGPGLDWERVAEHVLAVEVTSRSTQVYDRVYKRPAYLGLGVKEVWRVGPDTRVVLVSTPDAADVSCSEVVNWRPPGIEAELKIEVPPLFRGL